MVFNVKRTWKQDDKQCAYQMPVMSAEKGAVAPPTAAPAKNWVRSRTGQAVLLGSLLLVLFTVTILLLDVRDIYRALRALLAGSGSLLVVSLPSVTETDRLSRAWNCTQPMVHDGDQWHEARSGLWFQATDVLEEEDQFWRLASEPLRCSAGVTACSLTVSRVQAYASSLTWSGTTQLTAGLGQSLGAQVARKHRSITWAQQSATSVSYTCTVLGNQTVWLAIKPRDYLVSGYASEYDGTITAWWKWFEYCTPMLRVPKVAADGSVAGVRRCIAAHNKEGALEVVRRLQLAATEAERDLVAPLAWQEASSSSTSSPKGATAAADGSVQGSVQAAAAAPAVL